MDYINTGKVLLYAEANQINGQVTLYAVDQSSMKTFVTQERDWQQHRFHLRGTVAEELLTRADASLTIAPFRFIFGEYPSSDTQLRETGNARCLVQSLTNLSLPVQNNAHTRARYVSRNFLEGELRLHSLVNRTQFGIVQRLSDGSSLVPPAIENAFA
jgi:hypothetical protein